MTMMKLFSLVACLLGFLALAPTVGAIESIAVGKIPILGNLFCGCFDPECSSNSLGSSCNCPSDQPFSSGDSCDFEICCAARRLRRSLLSDATLQVHELDNVLLESCGMYDYEISVFAEDYDVYAIASPMEEAASANCPMLVADNSNMNKEVSVWNTKQGGWVNFDDPYPLGVHKLSKILKAYQKVDEVNNHRDYLAPLAEELELTVDSELSSHFAHKLWKSNLYIHGDDELESKSHLDICGEYDYELSLYVDNHMYVVATPKEDAAFANCPVLASHAVFGKEDTSKQMLVWNAASQDVPAFYAALPVGVYKLKDYVDAYKQTNPGSGPYDVVTNNCGDFVANMGIALGVTPTEEMSTYIVRNLMAQTSVEFKEKIRTSDMYHDLIQEDKNRSRQLRSGILTDQDVMKLLVESRM